MNQSPQRLLSMAAGAALRWFKAADSSFGDHYLNGDRDYQNDERSDGKDGWDDAAGVFTALEAALNSLNRETTMNGSDDDNAHEAIDNGDGLPPPPDRPMTYMGDYEQSWPKVFAAASGAQRYKLVDPSPAIQQACHDFDVTFLGYSAHRRLLRFNREIADRNITLEIPCPLSFLTDLALFSRYLSDEVPRGLMGFYEAQIPDLIGSVATLTEDLVSERAQTRRLSKAYDEMRELAQAHAEQLSKAQARLASLEAKSARRKSVSRKQKPTRPKTTGRRRSR